MATATKQELSNRHSGAMHLATAEPQIEYIPIAKIRADGGTQMRAGLNAETVAEYREWLSTLQAREQMPPIIVYYDGTDYWLADGFHRLAAFREETNQVNPFTIQAKVHAGDRRAAILHAAGANSEHGLRRTNADKRRAVETLLRDPEWSGWNQSDIARHCRVSREYVSRVKGDLADELSCDRSQDSPKAVTRGDSTYQMNTANIGQKPEPKPEPVAEMPATLTAEGYRLIDTGNGLWRWEQAHFRSEPFHTAAEAVKDAYLDFEKSDTDEATPDATSWQEESEAAAAPPAEPRSVSVAWPTYQQYGLTVNGFRFEETDQGWRYLWRRYDGERVGPLVADRAACEQSAMDALAAHQAGQEVMPGGQTYHDHVMDGVVFGIDRDINFKIALDAATLDQLREALQYIPEESNKSKRARIEARIRKLEKQPVVELGGEDVPLGPVVIEQQAPSQFFDDAARKQPEAAPAPEPTAPEYASAPYSTTPVDPPMPNDLAEMGFCFMQPNPKMWAIVRDEEPEAYESNWFYDPADCIDDVREYLAADALRDFDLWIEAAPKAPDLRQCLAILEYAKTVAQRVRTLDPDLTNTVGNSLPTLSQLINRLEKKVKRG